MNNIEALKAAFLQELKNNPHFLQMVDIFVKRPDLLKRLEAQDMSVIQEVSDLAREHFLMLLVYTKLEHEDVRQENLKEAMKGNQEFQRKRSALDELSHKIYTRLRQGA